MSRLTLLHINIIGAVLAVIVGVALYFTIITGAQEQIKKNTTDYEGVKTRADKLDTATRNLKNANLEKVKTEADYAVMNVTYMPVLGYTKNRIQDMMRIWWPNNGKSWPERFIKGFRAHMDKQRKQYAVEWLNPEVLALPSYGPDPNSIDWGNGGALHYGPYAMAVRGKSYQALMSHLRSWNSIKGMGMPVVEGDTLSGNSPNLIVSYNVTFTVILKEEIPPQDPRVAGGGGGGGGGFGRPMGMPGMGGMGGMGSGMGGMGSGGMGGPPAGMMSGGIGSPGGGGAGPKGGGKMD